MNLYTLHIVDPGEAFFLLFCLSIFCFCIASILNKVRRKELAATGAFIRLATVFGVLFVAFCLYKVPLKPSLSASDYKFEVVNFENPDLPVCDAKHTTNCATSKIKWNFLGSEDPSICKPNGTLCRINNLGEWHHNQNPASMTNSIWEEFKGVTAQGAKELTAAYIKEGKTCHYLDKEMILVCCRKQ